MIGKILYGILGILAGGLIYASLLGEVPKPVELNITTQKPVIESSIHNESTEQDKYNNDNEAIKVLNENFKPVYDELGQLLDHPSGYEYVYDSNNEPVGLINGYYLNNVMIDDTNKKSENKTRNDDITDIPYAYTIDGIPVGYITEVGVIFEGSYTDTASKVNEFDGLLSNLYFVDDNDIRYFESINLVSYGQENPMLFTVHKIEDIEEEEEDIIVVDVSDFEYEDIEELDIASYETVGFDTNIGDLVVIDVSDIELRIKNNGVLPVDNIYYDITSPFGPRSDPFTGEERFHVGLDIASTGIPGRPVRSILSGTVEIMSSNNSLGNFVVISHGSFNTVYAHMEAFSRDLAIGDEVNSGDSIGYVGTTGRSTGYHLHVEFDVDGIKLNPERFMDIITGVRSVSDTQQEDTMDEDDKMEIIDIEDRDKVDKEQ